MMFIQDLLPFKTSTIALRDWNPKHGDSILDNSKAVIQKLDSITEYKLECTTTVRL